jgi:hypothetical protein
MLHSKVCQPFCCNVLVTLALCCPDSTDSSAVHSYTVCFGIDGQEQMASSHFRAIAKRSRPFGTASLLQWTPLFWRRGPPKETQHTSAHTHTDTDAHTNHHTHRHNLSIQERTTASAQTKNKVHMNDKRTSYEPRKKFI